MPKLKGKDAALGELSESATLERLEEIGLAGKTLARNIPWTDESVKVSKLFEEMVYLVGRLRTQVERGIHTNPLVTYALGMNPAGRMLGKRGELGGEWSNRVEEIRYRHVDGKYYKHSFERGVCLHGNADGSVTLYRRDGRPLWEDFDA